MAAITATASVVRRRPGRLTLAGLAVLGWVLVYAFFRDRHTLFLHTADVTGLHTWIGDLRSWVDEHRSSSPVFMYFFDTIRISMRSLVTFLQGLVSQGNPIPEIGWLGVVAIAAFVAWLSGNLKVAALAAVGFTFLGLQGLWQESMDTLALVAAAVLVSLLVGIPLGVWAGTSARFNAVVTPVLDFMQTMPTFVYLAPLTLFFLIGPASAAIATMIYATPPVIRITAHGIRTVPSDTVEATRSLGATSLQSLVKVLLPMARRTIILGINQTMMAALSMVTIAALIDAPGLGKTVLRSLQALDVGASFNGGLAIVIMAIVLDRTATAAGTRARSPRPAAADAPVWWRRHRVHVGAAAAGVAYSVYLSRTYVWAAEFPTALNLGGRSIDIRVGDLITRRTNIGNAWVQDHFGDFTRGLKNVVSRTVLDGLQQLLTLTPWYATVALFIVLAALAGGRRVAAIVAVCMLLLVGTGLWWDAMTTLAATLLATFMVVSLGVVVGVWMGRSAGADRAIRPVLDAAQVMPPFVYLVPFLALFEATRFTSIIAAVVYAAPVAIKIVADGIRGVSAATVEAATAAGSNAWQIITKVQLPMARSSLMLATNQGLIYVLAMVVVGGLVGGGALGYDVVAGFNQLGLYGKGLAAGMAIVLLGIVLDRVSQAAARRVGGGTRSSGKE